MGSLHIAEERRVTSDDAWAGLAGTEENVLFGEIMNLIARLGSHAARHAELCATDEATMFENMSAVRWIDAVLEDVAATVMGVSRSATP